MSFDPEVARRAYDVMMLRKWRPVYIRMNGDWTVFDEDDMPLGDECRSGCPFRSLDLAEQVHGGEVEGES